MSGQAGGRGYLIQAVIAVLDALSDREWTECVLEPNLVEDKVDLLLRSSRGDRVSQIKSSENAIGAAQVRAWAESLEAAYPDAIQYELRLIGPVTKGARSPVGNVEIPVPQALNIRALLDQCAHRLDRYLRDLALGATRPAAREMLAEALATRFGTFSANGEVLSRERLQTLLAEWVKELLPSDASDMASTRRQLPGATTGIPDVLSALARALGAGTVGDIDPRSAPIAHENEADAAVARVAEALVGGAREIAQRFGANLQAGGFLLASTVSLEPPPLPDPHVSRARSFGEIAKLLETSALLAVVGYPKSGKTSAMAEFVRQNGADCIWLTAPPLATASAAWADAINYQISQHLGLSRTDCAAVRDALISSALVNRLMVVVDDAHLIPDLASVSFLEQAADASGGRLRVLLIGVDNADFKARLRSLARRDTRLPGFNETEAIAFYHYLGSGESLTGNQRKALDFLCLKTDGHPGMLRLAFERIREIHSADNLGAFISDLRSSYGADLDAFQSSLMATFLGTLHDAELQLSRRLAITFRAFTRRLALAVWLVDFPRARFLEVWSSCVLRVFDKVTPDRFLLPELYKNGLIEHSEAEERRGWHTAAANELSKPRKGTLDPFDVCNAVAHRVCAGDLSRAFNDAAGFLALAKRPSDTSIRHFLLTQFEFSLYGRETGSDVEPAALVRWYAARVMAFGDFHERDKAAKAATNLGDLLTSKRCKDVSAIGLGGSVLLLHAAATGDADGALRADAHMREYSDADQARRWDWIAHLVIIAHLVARRSPIAYIRAILGRRQARAVALWGGRSRFEFWSTVAAVIYQDIERSKHVGSNGFRNKYRLLRRLSKNAAEAGETELSLLFSALLSRVQIDVARDFNAATRTAIGLEVSEVKDRALLAHLHHTVGNALRCSGDPASAAEAYRKALAQWPASRVANRAESMFMLGISVARLGELKEALCGCLEAARLYGTEQHDWLSLLQADCLLEAAVVAIRDGAIAKALRSLLRAHRLLKERHMGRPEWVALGQLAWHIAARLAGSDGGPELAEPGFTIGLRGPQPGSERMEPMAPTLMLARAFTVFGSPNRALALYADAEAGLQDRALQPGIGALAIDASISLRRLGASIRYAGQAATLLSDVEHARLPHAGPFIFDYILGRVTALAVSFTTQIEMLAQLDDAIGEIRGLTNSENPATKLLTAVLSGIDSAIRTENCARLEAAFAMAISAEAMHVARQLSWFWAFRFAVGRRIELQDLLVWQWRLAWLTLELVGSDDRFVADSIVQQQDFWSRALPSLDHPLAAEVDKVLKATGSPPREALSVAANHMATLVIEQCGVGRWVKETAYQVATVKNLQSIVPARDTAIARMGELILFPTASEKAHTIRADLESLRAAVAARPSTGDDELVKWWADIGYLHELVAFALNGTASLLVLEALSRVAPYVRGFKKEAAANFYVWLRHCVASAPSDPEQARKMQTLLVSDHAAELSEDESIPSFLHMRVGAAHFWAKGRLEVFSLLEAIATDIAQRSLPGPVSREATEALDLRIVDLFKAIKESLKGLSNLAEQCADQERYFAEMWHIRMNCGELRRAVGFALVAHPAVPRKAEKWLRHAANDFSAALEAVANADDATERRPMRLQAAYEGLAVAEMLGDGKINDRFNEVITEYRTCPELAEELQRFDAAHEEVRLHIGERKTGQVLLSPDDDAAIARQAEMMMQAAGLPNADREKVEGFVRSVAYGHLMQRDYCRHLEPLHNGRCGRLLCVKHSTATDVMPGEWTCSCMLLGYETKIPIDDIRIAIESMKRNYCDGCQKRHPELDQKCDAASTARTD